MLLTYLSKIEWQIDISGKKAHGPLTHPGLSRVQAQPAVYLSKINTRVN